MKPEDGPPEYLTLLSKLPADRYAEARAAWLRAMQDRKQSLEALDATLGEVLLSLEKLAAIYDTRRNLLEEMNAFIVSRIYWVRDEDPVGLATVLGVRDEIAADRPELHGRAAPPGGGGRLPGREAPLRAALPPLRRPRRPRRLDHPASPALPAAVGLSGRPRPRGPPAHPRHDPSRRAGPRRLGPRGAPPRNPRRPPLLAVPGRIVLYGIAIASLRAGGSSGTSSGRTRASR